MEEQTMRLNDEIVHAYLNKVLPIQTNLKIKCLSLLVPKVKKQIADAQKLYPELTTKANQKNRPSTSIIKWGTLASCCFLLIFLIQPDTPSYTAKGKSLGIHLYAPFDGKNKIAPPNFKLSVGDTLQALPLDRKKIQLNIYSIENSTITKVFPTNEAKPLFNITQLPPAIVLDDPGVNHLFFISSNTEIDSLKVQQILSNWDGSHSKLIEALYIQYYKIEGVSP
jgi:hypothetical protein